MEVYFGKRKVCTADNMTVAQLRINRPEYKVINCSSSSLFNINIYSLETSYESFSTLGQAINIPCEAELRNKWEKYATIYDDFSGFIYLHLYKQDGIVKSITSTKLWTNASLHSIKLIVPKKQLH